MEAIKYPNVKSIQIIFNIFRQKPLEVFFEEAAKNNVAIDDNKANESSKFPVSAII